MPRVKIGNVTRKRRKKTLKLAKGYFGSKHLLYKTAHEQVMRSLAYSYRDRRRRKRDFRKLWITRINAASRLNGLSYSRLINGLSLAGVSINRKVLADMAVNDPDGFAQVATAAKKGLNGEVERPDEVPSTKGYRVIAGKPQDSVEKPQESAEGKQKPAPKAKPKTPKREPVGGSTDLADKTVADLKALCKERGLQGYSALKKAELIELLSK